MRAPEEKATTSKKQVITIVTSSLNEYDLNLVGVFCSEMRGKGGKNESYNFVENYLSK